MTFDFNLDDDLVTMAHPRTSKGLSGIVEIMRSPYYEDASGYSYEYRPLTHISFALEHALLGGTPFSGHLVNTMLYAFTCLVLFRLLLVILPNTGTVFPVVTTLLFMVHPMHVEAVASIKNREELLALLGALGAMFSVGRYLEVKGVLWLVWAFMAMVLSLLAKMSAVPFLFILPLLATFRSAGTRSFSVLLPIGGIMLLAVLALWSWLPYQWLLLAVLTASVGVSFVHVIYGYGDVLREGISQVTHTTFSGIRTVVSPSFWKPILERTWDLLVWAYLPLAVVTVVGGFILGSLWAVYMGVGMIAFRIARDSGGSWIMILLYLSAVLLALVLKVGTLSSMVIILCSVLVMGAVVFRQSGHLRSLMFVHVILALMHVVLHFFYDEVVWTDFVIAFGGYSALYLLLFSPFYFAEGDRRLRAGRWLMLVLGIGFPCFVLYTGWFFDDWSGLWSFTLVLLAAAPILIFRPGQWSFQYYKFLVFLPLLVTVVDQQVINPFRFGLPEEVVVASTEMDEGGLLGQFNEGIQSDAEFSVTEPPSRLQPSTDQAHPIAPYTSVIGQLLGHNSERPLHHLEYPLGIDASWGQRIATAAVVIVHYTRQMFIPHPQSFYYGYSYFDRYEPDDIKAIVAFVVIAVMILFGLWLTYLRAPSAMGIWMFLASIAMFSNLIEPIAGMVADRLTYVASLGFCIAAGHGFQVVWSRWRRPAEVALLVVLVLFTGMTVYRSSKWKNRLTLMRNDVTVVPNSAQAHNLLASNLMQASFDPKVKEKPVDMRHEAIHHFRESLRIWPNTLNVWYDLGRAYMTVNQRERALPCFKAAYGLDSTFTDAAWSAALVAQELGRDTVAIEYYHYCIRFSPELDEAYSRLSYLYFTRGEHEKSIAVNRMAIAHEPRWRAPYENVAQVFEVLGMPDSSAVYIGRRDRMLGKP